MTRRRLISEQVREEMYRLYKEDGLRAQDIADKYQCSVQHVLKIFRIKEGKPVWSKKHQSVMYSERIGNRWFATRNNKEDV